MGKREWKGDKISCHFSFHRRLASKCEQPRVKISFIMQHIEEKCKCQGFMGLVAVVTSVSCNHTPCALGGAGRNSAHVCPFSLHLFSCCQALAADHTPSLLCCHPVPSSLPPVINKKWGDASWMDVSGTTPGWAKSALKLAFFVVMGSNSVTFTDGKAQSIPGSKGYRVGKWELLSPKQVGK